MWFYWCHFTSFYKPIFTYLYYLNMITKTHKSKQCTNTQESDLCPWLTSFPSSSSWASLYSVFYAHNAQLNKQDVDLWPWPTLFPKKQFMSQLRPCDLYTQLPNTQGFDLWPMTSTDLIPLKQLVTCWTCGPPYTITTVGYFLPASCPWG